MSEASAALPDDVEALKRLVLGRDETIAKLLAEIARLKRWRFGRSAERMDAALMQLQLSLDDLQLPADPQSLDQAALPLEDSTQTPPSNSVRRMRISRPSVPSSTQFRSISSAMRVVSSARCRTTRTSSRTTAF